MRKLLLSFALFVAGIMTVGATVTIPETGVYTIEGGSSSQEHRGFLAATEGYDYPVLSNIQWSTYAENSATPITNSEHWYVKSNNNGKFYIYNLGINKFIAAGTGTNINFSDTPYEWQIVVNGSNNNYVSIRDTEATTFLCFACGKKANSRPVFFNNQVDDGGSMHTFTVVENGETTYNNAIANINKRLEGFREINYALIDNLGMVYKGVYMGFVGETLPTITGVDGYSVNSATWNGNNYTANIVFPFPISNENITNATTISSFKNNNNNFLWYSEGTGIKATKDATANSDNYWWAIYPAYNEGSFTFTIKNVGTGKFIHSTSNQNSHGEGIVTLGDTPSKFTVEANNKFKLPTGKYLSLNSSSATSAQTVGTWGDHGGTYNKFPTASLYHAVSATIGDAGYATLYAPVALTIPEELVAYTSLYNSDKTTLTLTPLTAGVAIPANTGIILEGAPGTYPLAKAENAEAIADNVLTGTASGIATSSVEGAVYTLQEDGDDIAFMQYTGIALSAGKAYLKLDDAPASAISVRFEGTTDIDVMESTANGQQSTAIYDLLGRRVEAMTKGGIYIVNGKKVVIK